MTKASPREDMIVSNARRSLAQPEFALPLDTPPMDARTADALPDFDGPWQYEPKWDGFRCLAFKAGGAVELKAKSGKSLGRYFPEIVALLATNKAARFVIDGELVIEIEGRFFIRRPASPLAPGRKPYPQARGRNSGTADPVRHSVHSR